MRAALKFYADREHYHFESGNWDTVSGEPLNILWCGDEPDFIEDGSVARAALERKPSDDIPDFTPGKGNRAWHRATSLVTQLHADLTSRDQRIDELESQLMPDLHSRPEERGEPKKEPCGGCGVPGWTGNCPLCIPY